MTDYLGAHPDALLRGRRADDKLAPMPPSPAPVEPSQGSKP
jgi:paraquat-inducible protein B